MVVTTGETNDSGCVPSDDPPQKCPVFPAPDPVTKGDALMSRYVIAVRLFVSRDGDSAAALSNLKKRLGRLGVVTEERCIPYWKIPWQVEVFVVASTETPPFKQVAELLDDLGPGWLIRRPFDDDMDAIWNADDGKKVFAIPGVAWANMMAHPEAEQN